MSDLPAMVQALLDPGIYPERPEKVEMLQTQMSFVFLAGDYVYKVKKPVNLGYLDYTNLEQRKYFCEQEVRLNRRLCPAAYLGVVPITAVGEKYRLGGGGEPVEYAVKMKRLPQERMLDGLLGRDEVSAEMITAVAEKMAEFHNKAETGPDISVFGGLDAITGNNDENFTQAEPYVGRALDGETYRRLQNFTGDFIREKSGLFLRRVAEGRIRDCHGDLHAAHVCFTGDICIYDCIEFNDRFRYCDVASEVAFLAMDLDHYGRADLAHYFIEAYVAHSRDEELEELLKFYKCYRACVRGKVACFQLDDPYIAGEEKDRIRGVAAGYFDLGAAYARSRPLLAVTVGLTGTGKSALAREMARRFGLAVISSDVTRKRLAGISPTEHRYDEFSSGIYTAEYSRLTYNAMYTEAARFLAGGVPVILDAAFLKAGERQQAREVARQTGADFLVIECTLDETAVRERLERRRMEVTASDGRPEVLEFQRGVFEPVVEEVSGEHVIIDTSPPVGELVNKLRPVVLGLEE